MENLNCIKLYYYLYIKKERKKERNIYRDNSCNKKLKKNKKIKGRMPCLQLTSYGSTTG